MGIVGFIQAPLYLVLLKMLDHEKKNQRWYSSIDAAICQQPLSSPLRKATPPRTAQDRRLAEGYRDTFLGPIVEWRWQSGAGMLVRIGGSRNHEEEEAGSCNKVARLPRPAIFPGSLTNCGTLLVLYI